MNKLAQLLALAQRYCRADETTKTIASFTALACLVYIALTTPDPADAWVVIAAILCLIPTQG